MDKVIKALLLGVLLVGMFLPSFVVAAEEESGRWVSPGWQKEIVNVVEYKNGDKETRVDFNTLAWGDVAKVGFRVLPGGFMTGFDAEYGQLLWYPTSAYYDKPVMYGFLRFWGKHDGEWYKKFLNTSGSKTPYYEEETYIHNESKTGVRKELGWSSSFTIGSYVFPYYVGQRVDTLSPSSSIKTRVTTPVYLEDTALEYIFVVNPDLYFWEKIKYARITLSIGTEEEPAYDIRDIPINQLADESGDLPEMLKGVSFMLDDGREIAFFNFQDIWDQGISGHWKIDQVTLPNGQTSWALHIGEMFGPLGAEQTLDIDPGWLSPTGHVDPDSAWTDEVNAYDENTATFALTASETAYLELTHTAINCNKIQIWLGDEGLISPNVDIDVYYSSAWHNIHSGVLVDDEWVEKEIGSTQLVTSARVKFNAAKDAHYLHEFDFYEILSAPAVTTSAATSVEETTATLNGDVTAVNDTNITERGFVWDTVTRGAPGDVAPASSGYACNWTESGSWTTGTFNHGLTSLTKGELYYVRACAYNDAGHWGYGDEVTFLTKPDAPTGLSATAGSQQVGLSWTKGTGTDDTIVRGKIDGYPANYDTDTDVYSSTASSTTHSALTNGDHWYYRAWSYCTEGGKEKYSDGYVQADATPLGYPLVTTSMATNVTTSVAVLNGDVTSLGAGGNIVERGFVWGTTSYGDPGDVAPGGTSYGVNWTESGSWGTGTFNHEVVSLVEGQTYYYRACAENGVGWAYGGEVAFTVFGMRLWFEPNTMINPTNLPDRSGWGNTGTINWGTNPAGLEVTISGTLSYDTYTVPEGEDIEILPPPTDLELFEDTSATGADLPMYASVSAAATAVGWTTPIMYSVLMLIFSIGFGFAGMIAVGTIWGFVIGFGTTLTAAAVGTGMIAPWVVLISVIFVVLMGYVWRHT